jgi:excisionase family DNA binding protein
MGNDSTRPYWLKGLDDATTDLAERGILTVESAAKFAGSGKKWIYGLIQAGLLPARKSGKRLIVRKQDLERLMGFEQA